MEYGWEATLMEEVVDGGKYCFQIKKEKPYVLQQYNTNEMKTYTCHGSIEYNFLFFLIGVVRGSAPTKNKDIIAIRIIVLFKKEFNNIKWGDGIHLLCSPCVKYYL